MSSDTVPMLFLKEASGRCSACHPGKKKHPTLLYVVLALGLLNFLLLVSLAGGAYLAFRRFDAADTLANLLVHTASSPRVLQSIHNTTDALSGHLIQTLATLLDPWPVDAFDLVNYVMHSDVSNAATSLGRVGERIVVALNETSFINNGCYGYYCQRGLLQIAYTASQVLQIVGEIDYLQPLEYQPRSLLGVIAQAFLNSTNGTNAFVSPTQQYDLALTCISLAQRVQEVNWSWWAFEGMQHVDVNVHVRQVVADIIQICQNIAQTAKDSHQPQPVATLQDISNY